MCYKGDVYAPCELNEFGKITLLESAFAKNEQAYAILEDIGQLTITKNDRTASEVWKLIDLDKLPRKNKATKSVNRFEGLTIPEMADLIKDEQKSQQNKMYTPLYTLLCRRDGSVTKTDHENGGIVTHYSDYPEHPID